MGQGIGGLPEAPAVARDVAGGREPIGRYIAQQRRLRGIDLDDLAARTRIPRRSLERLEAGAFDQSPDGFSRGFVRTVAEAIGLDPDAAVARMLPEPDATRRGKPPARRMVGALAALAVLAGLALAGRELAFRMRAVGEPRAAGSLPVRRDYVRALAEAQGIDTAKLADRSAVLPPLPPEEVAPAAVAQAEPAPAAARAPAQAPAQRTESASGTAAVTGSSPAPSAAPQELAAPAPATEGAARTTSADAAPPANDSVATAESVPGGEPPVAPGADEPAAPFEPLPATDAEADD